MLLLESQRLQAACCSPFVHTLAEYSKRVHGCSTLRTGAYWSQSMWTGVPPDSSVPATPARTPTAAA